MSLERQLMSLLFAYDNFPQLKAIPLTCISPTLTSSPLSTSSILLRQELMLASPQRTQNSLVHVEHQNQPLSKGSPYDELFARTRVRVNNVRAFAPSPLPLPGCAYPR